MKHGSSTIQDAVKRPERDGYRWASPFCMKSMLKACGEPWDGYVIRGPTQSPIPFQLEEFSMVACHTY